MDELVPTIIELFRDPFSCRLSDAIIEHDKFAKICEAHRERETRLEIPVTLGEPLKYAKKVSAEAKIALPILDSKTHAAQQARGLHKLITCMARKDVYDYAQKLCSTASLNKISAVGHPKPVKRVRMDGTFRYAKLSLAAAFNNHRKVIELMRNNGIWDEISSDQKEISEELIKKIEDTLGDLDGKSMTFQFETGCMSRRQPVVRDFARITSLASATLVSKNGINLDALRNHSSWYDTISGINLAVEFSASGYKFTSIRVNTCKTLFNLFDHHRKIIMVDVKYQCPYREVGVYHPATARSAEKIFKQGHLRQFNNLKIRFADQSLPFTHYYSSPADALASSPIAADGTKTILYSLIGYDKIVDAKDIGGFANIRFNIGTIYRCDGVYYSFTDHTSFPMFALTLRHTILQDPAMTTS